MCSNGFKTCSNVSNVFQPVQNLFKCVQMCSKLFKNYQIFQCMGSDMTSRAWSSLHLFRNRACCSNVHPYLALVIIESVRDNLLNVAVGLQGWRSREGWVRLKMSSSKDKPKTLITYRVAELGSLSSGAKMAMKIFVKRVFTIFASNASFLRVIANLQN